MAKVNDKVMEGITKDVSPDGAYVCCARPLRPNVVFDMVIKAPDKSISVKAEVVWSNIYGPDDEITPRGMGVRFIKIGSEDRKFIAQASLKHLETAKIEPALLDTLNTLIIDLSENDSDIKPGKKSDVAKTTPAVS